MDQERVHLALLWLGLLLPPLAWTVQMAAMYTAQPWQCLHPEGISVSDSTSLLAALAALAGGAVAWVGRRKSLASASQPAEQQLRSRARFMSSLGVALCVLFLLVIIAQWIPNHLLSPCPA
jgi:hypothetical protein